MNLTGLHILLTYKCTYECDHCFVWGSPEQSGVFNLEQLEEVMKQAVAVETVKEIYFEGGETFIYYPILVQAIERAKVFGFRTGVVTNGYWITNQRDATNWLKPLVGAGLDELAISCDALHGNENNGEMGLAAAKQLGLSAYLIKLDPPTGYRDPEQFAAGEALTGGDIMYRGRAAVKLTADLPKQPWDTLKTCPYEDLANPTRMHLDPFGYLHICQGIVMGNIWQRPLRQIVEEYDPIEHPIAGPLLAGGPALLARIFSLDRKEGYVDACHLCYEARDELRAEFPGYLAPDQMYGVVA